MFNPKLKTVKNFALFVILITMCVIGFIGNFLFHTSATQELMSTFFGTYLVMFCIAVVIGVEIFLVFLFYMVLTDKKDNI